MARMTSSPCRSGRNMSSRTTSTCSDCRARIASWLVAAVAATTKPGTRVTYAAWASRATGSSSTTRTRRSGTGRLLRGGVRRGLRAARHEGGGFRGGFTGGDGEPHGEAGPGRPGDLQLTVEPAHRLGDQGQADPPAPGAALLLGGEAAAE